MIVFAIAHGESYIRKLADFCLPSLLAPGNLPCLSDEKPELAIFTVDTDVGLVTKLLNKPEIAASFGDRRQVFAVKVLADSSTEQLPKFKAAVTRHLLRDAVDYCLKKDRSFLFAVPDLVFSNGAIKTSWQLHRMTGKMVSIFNGRVQSKVDEPPFSPALMPKLTREQGVRDFFFSNMVADWHNWTTTDPDVIPDPTLPGHLILKSDHHSFVFSRPNPVIGRFTQRDLMFFTDERVSLWHWDHDWQDALLREGRLQVQTNLDLGMSIELEDGAYGPTYSADSLVDESGGPSVTEQRESKFAFNYAGFTFTTTHR